MVSEGSARRVFAGISQTNGGPRSFVRNHEGTRVRALGSRRGGAKTLSSDRAPRTSGAGLRHGAALSLGRLFRPGRGAGGVVVGVSCARRTRRSRLEAPARAPQRPVREGRSPRQGVRRHQVILGSSGDEPRSGHTCKQSARPRPLTPANGIPLGSHGLPSCAPARRRRVVDLGGPPAARRCDDLKPC
jgi:hypothetical protein